MSIVNSRPSRHTIFGVRHHGPGSAYSLVKALDDLQPDIVLVEGPADATELIPWLGDEQMEPLVALVLYDPDEPKRASYFPFAIFSPELQAIHHALERGIPARFIDLPQSAMLASPHKVSLYQMRRSFACWQRQAVFKITNNGGINWWSNVSTAPAFSKPS